MKKYLIKTPEKYTKDGVEKTFWHTIGTVAMFDNDGSIKIPAIGLNAKLYPVEEKTPVAQPVAETPQTSNSSVTERSTQAVDPSYNPEYPMEDLGTPPF
jgi:lipopolysaccharide export system protein LptC